MEFLQQYNLQGVVIAICTFLIIGLFHPLVIKGEYYFGEKIKYLFGVVGVLLLIPTFLVENTLFSALLGVTSCSCFWSIKEIGEQVERVRKGWFPANPKRAAKYQKAK